MYTYQEPIGAGRGGDEYVAATRFMASIHAFISFWFLQKQSNEQTTSCQGIYYKKRLHTLYWSKSN